MSHFAYPMAAAFTTALGITSALANIFSNDTLDAVQRLTIAFACGVAMCAYLIWRRQPRERS
jgi:hypothetical protein